MTYTAFIWKGLVTALFKIYVSVLMIGTSYFKIDSKAELIMYVFVKWL